MKIRKAIKSDSVKDFSSLFFSNILQKVFGLIRELIVASFFGSALIYANYILLRTVADLFSQFTVGNALKANLLPKFTRILEKYNKVSFSKVFDFSKKTMLLLFVLSQIIQSFIIWHLDTNYTLELILISVLLSISISFNFLNTIYLTFIQAQGKFLRYSLATTLNSFLFLALVKPLILLLNISGLVISRLIGILTLTFSYVLPMNKQKEGFVVELSNKDFNFPTLILGNFANIIILSSRFMSGSDGGNGIAYFTYSVLILNAFFTSVVGNISTLLLRKFSIKRNNIFMYYSLIISVMISVFLVICCYFFSSDIIDFIYRRVISFFSDHNRFTTSDVRNTSKYLYELSYSFIFIFIATTLFQPFLSLSIEKSKKARRNISIIFISVILLVFLYSYFRDLEVYKSSLIMIYLSSFVSVVLSIYSYYYYLKSDVQKE